MTIEKAYDLLYKKLQHWLEEIIVILPNLALSLLILAFFYLVASLFRSFLNRLLKGFTHNENIDSLLATSVFVGILVTGVFSALGVLHLDKAVTSLLAGAGIVGLALGFAFQDIAQNFMSGIGMAIKRPFKIGDIVETGGKTGIVKEINIRTTALETFSGEEILIPNKEVYQNVIINYMSHEYIRIKIPFFVNYTNDLEAIRNLIVAELSPVENSVASKTAVHCIEMGENTVKMEAHLWVNPAGNLDVKAKSDSIIRIKSALEKNNVSIPGIKK